jgi:hypothetical protein
MMGPTPAAASRALRDTLQLLLSCVTTAVLQTDATGPTIILTGGGRLARRPRGHVQFFLLHDFIVVSGADRPRSERWRARTVGYQYRLEDAGGREIVAYHWHPQGQSHVTVPHLHLGVGLGAILPEMTEAHLQTGMVAPVAILAIAVENFGVVARRADWVAIFARASHDLLPM